jgi:hypothetical protein
VKGEEVTLIQLARRLSDAEYDLESIFEDFDWGRSAEERGKRGSMRAEGRSRAVSESERVIGGGMEKFPAAHWSREK